MIDVLVVGAGPVGLYAALLLARQGFNVRIIEKQKQSPCFSRAIGMNARTLELFQESCMSDIFIDKGVKIHGTTIFEGDQQLGEINFSEIPSDFNFLLALPQSTIEQVFASALDKEGIIVERGVTLTYFIHTKNYVKARISYGESREFVKARYIIGADGGTSLVRELANIQMKGLTYPYCVELIDMKLAKPIEHFFIRSYVDYQGTPLIMIPSGNDQMRIVCPMRNSEYTLPYEYLPDGEIIHSSEYVIQKKIAKRFVKKRVVLIGDSAHICSPIGGRGMNLGFEDAYFLAKALKKGSLFGFNYSRRRRAKKVLNETHLFTKSFFNSRKKLKRRLLRALFRSPTLRKHLLTRNMGLK